MERLYPRALLECIQENRLPRQEEIETVAHKISREAFPDGDGSGMSMVLARTAMVGAMGAPRSWVPREA